MAAISAAAAAAAATTAAYLGKFSQHNTSLISSNPRVSRTTNSRTWRTMRVLAMAPKNKVNKYDPEWKKQWYGAGIFYEGSEEVEVDVFKKLEKKKVLSNVEKAGLLSKAEELGFTLSSIEKLGLFSKAEELGLLSLLEKAAALSPSTLASASLPFLAAAIAAIVLIPDDSGALVAAQVVVAGGLAAVAVGCFVGSIVLDTLQAD